MGKCILDASSERLILGLAAATRCNSRIIIIRWHLLHVAWWSSPCWIEASGVAIKVHCQKTIHQRF